MVVACTPAHQQQPRQEAMMDGEGREDVVEEACIVEEKDVGVERR